MKHAVIMTRTYETVMVVDARTADEAIAHVKLDVNRYQEELDQCNVVDETYTVEPLPLPPVKRISFLDLLQRLNSKVPLKFYYTKKDGTLREAIGTKYWEIIPQSAQPEGIRKASTTSLPYYDYQSEGWRRVYIGAEIFVEA
jgi:hypothetical protein